MFTTLIAARITRITFVSRSPVYLLYITEDNLEIGIGYPKEAKRGSYEVMLYAVVDENCPLCVAARDAASGNSRRKRDLGGRDTYRYYLK